MNALGIGDLLGFVDRTAQVQENSGLSALIVPFWLLGTIKQGATLKNLNDYFFVRN